MYSNMLLCSNNLCVLTQSIYESSYCCIYVSSYCYIRLYMCPRTTIHYYICVLILLNTIYMSSSCLYMCPQTAIFVSSYCYICVLMLLSSAFSLGSCGDASFFFSGVFSHAEMRLFFLFSAPFLGAHAEVNADNCLILTYNGGFGSFYRY